MAFIEKIPPNCIHMMFPFCFHVDSGILVCVMASGFLRCAMHPLLSQETIYFRFLKWHSPTIVKFQNFDEVRFHGT